MPDWSSLTPQPGEEVEKDILGYHKVWFTWHALQRMKERHVAKSEVYGVLENPTMKGLKAQKGRSRWRKCRDGRRNVDVVFERWSDRLCIITVIAD
jgi:hypothetical protein